MIGKVAYQYLIKNKDIINEFTLIDVEYGKVKWLHSYSIDDLEEKMFKNDFDYWEDEEFEGKEDFTEYGEFYTYLYGVKFNGFNNIHIEQFTEGYVGALKRMLKETNSKEELEILCSKYHIGIGK